MLDTKELVATERATMVQTLKDAGPDAHTLCEGWQTRHMAAHLLLRESKPSVAAGIAVPPLADRTERITCELAESLDSQRKYEGAVESFANLTGPLGIRTRKPSADAAMNVIEYFVHIEDIRRAQPEWEPRKVSREQQAYMWSVLTKRAKMMAGKHFPQGLVLKAPEFSPEQKTVVKGKNPVTLTGEPGELVLYLFGRADQALVTADS